MATQYVYANDGEERRLFTFEHLCFSAIMWGLVRHFAVEKISTPDQAEQHWR